MESNVKKMDSRVSFYDVVFDGEYGWFCDVYTNTLCRIDVDTASISIEALIPFDGDTRPFQYGFIAKAGNILVLAPRSAFVVLLYDLADKTFREIGLETKIIGQFGAYNLFSGVKIYGSNAYLIPGRFPGIVKINLSAAEVTYLNDWYALLRQKVTDFDSSKVIFARCHCSEGSRLYLPCWQGNVIMIFDLETEKYSFLELPALHMALSSMCMDGDEIWIASHTTNRIFRVDREGKEIERIALERLGETGITFLVRCGRRLYAVPSYGNCLVGLDPETKECKKVCDLAMEAIEVPEELVVAQTNMLSCVKDSEERIWMYSVFDGKIYRCSADGNVETYNAVLEKKEDVRRRNNHYIKMLVSENILQESSQCGIEEFLGYVLEE